MRGDDHIRATLRLGGTVILLVVGLQVMLCPASAETPVPPKTHAEQLTYDPIRGWSQPTQPEPGTEDGDLDIARQWMALQEYKTARNILKGWIEQYGPASGRYSEAVYLKATIDLELGEYRAADEGYQELLNDYPGSPFAEKALSGRFRVAEQYLAGQRRKAWKGLLRVKDREGGIRIMDDIILNYPDTPLAALAQKAKADYYYARGEYEMAEAEYATFAREYPRDRYHSLALFKSAMSALASFPGVLFDDAGLIEAQERFHQFRRDYPDKAGQMDIAALLDQISAHRAEKTYRIARFYEKTAKYAAARYYYRATIDRWPNTPAAAESDLRLAGLGEAHEAMVETEAGSSSEPTQENE